MIKCDNNFVIIYDLIKKPLTVYLNDKQLSEFVGYASDNKIDYMVLKTNKN